MSKLCYGCMKMKTQSPICEHCGYNENVPNYPHQLPIGTVLRDQYVVGKVLGQGGFGITYIGWDQSLENPVAIKEYYPSSFVTRDASKSLSVTGVGGNAMDQFFQNRDQFLKEARVLAKLTDVPGIIRVHNLFKENDTAYIIMEYAEGIDLKRYMRMRERTLTVPEVLAVMRPVMEALKVVHDGGMIHQDISPDNIMIQSNGKAKLLDFGAVREVFSTDGGQSQTGESVMKQGFAPMEQYSRKGGMGPWTDIYALCATMFYCLTGRVPNSAPERIIGNENVDWKQVEGLTETQIAVLEKGMAIVPEQRISSIQELYNGLFGDLTAMTGFRATEFSVVQPAAPAEPAKEPAPVKEPAAPAPAPAAPVKEAPEQSSPAASYPSHTISLEETPAEKPAPQPEAPPAPTPKPEQKPETGKAPAEQKTEGKKKNKLIPILIGVVACVAAILLITTVSEPKNGLVEEENGIYYYVEDVPQTGWQTIEDQKYYFNDDGLMQTGWQTIYDKKYYFDNDGVMLTGLQTIDGKKYHLGSSGDMQTGWKVMNDQNYFFTSDGIMATEWQTINEKTYYFGTDGIMRIELQTIDGKKYHFGSSGVMQIDTWKTIGDQKYYFTSDGTMATQWQIINGKNYYFGTDGVMRTGQQTIDGKQYYFGGGGIMHTGWKKINGTYYFYGKDGVLQQH